MAESSFPTRKAFEPSPPGNIHLNTFTLFGAKKALYLYAAQAA
jgi:hypothetical protein